MLRACWTTVFGIFCFVSVCLADEKLDVGGDAPTSIVAEFVTGKWAEYGTVCPVLANRDATKIAVFVKRLDDLSLPLIEAIDQLVSENESLQWSFVFVSHENAPTPSDEEWNTQLEQLREASKTRKVAHLSLGAMIRIPDTGKPVRAKRQLGFFGDGDMVVMLIGPDGNKIPTVIRFVNALKSTDVEESSIKQVIGQLKDALAEKPDKN